MKTFALPKTALVAGVGTLLALAACSSGSGRVTLVEEGQSKATIVIPSGAGDEVRFAATELQTYLKKISGATLPLAEDGREISETRVFIGPSRLTREAGVDLGQLKAGGFVIQTMGDDLAVVGKDDEGTRCGVSELLEILGVRWYWPGELGEVVPRLATVTVDPLDIAQSPDFAWRDRGPEGALWGATSGPTDMDGRALLLGITPEHQAEVKLWEKRNKWGGLKIYGGHCLGEVFPPEKYAKTHPEYYALVNGKRAVPGPDYDYKHGGQVCTSNPDVVKAAVAWARDFFDKHPDFDGVHMTMNDSGGFCECEKCRSLDSTNLVARPGIEAEEMGRAPRRTVITDRIFTYINQIAEEVEKTHPGKLVFSMAYSRYITPPQRIRLHPNVVPQYCLWSAYKHASPEFKNQHREISAGWAKLARRKGIYEYDINGSWPGLHRLVMSHIAESIKHLHSLGYDLYQTQSGDEFAINGMNYYVTGKLLWNTRLDERQILEDFYQKAFGPSGPAVRRFQQMLQDAWNKATEKGTDVSCNSLETTRLLDLFTPELLGQCDQALQDADRLAADPIVRKRVEFYRQGFRYTQLTVEATRKSKDLYKAGIEVMDLPKAQSQMARLKKSEAQQLLGDALRAWEERGQFVESLKNDYVLAYFWVKYNDISRDFNPVENLRFLAARAGPGS
ncbi:MAG: DUF4838 domain-containing protein [Acidobacteriota bacterium]